MLKSNITDNLELSMIRFTPCAYEKYSLHRVTEFEESNVVFQLMRDLGHISDQLVVQLNHSLWEEITYPKCLQPITKYGDEEEGPEAPGDLLFNLIFLEGDGSNLELCNHTLHQVSSYMLDFKCSYHCEELQRKKYKGFVLNECCYSEPDFLVRITRTWHGDGLDFFVHIRYVSSAEILPKWNYVYLSMIRPINVIGEIDYEEGLMEMETFNVLKFPMFWMLPRWAPMTRCRYSLKQFSDSLMEVIGWYRVFQRLTGRKYRKTRNALSSCCKRFLHAECWVGYMKHQSCFEIDDGEDMY
jgi:hypothetical protein